MSINAYNLFLKLWKLFFNEILSSSVVFYACQQLDYLLIHFLFCYKFLISLTKHSLVLVLSCAILDRIRTNEVIHIFWWNCIQGGCRFWFIDVWIKIMKKHNLIDKYIIPLLLLDDHSSIVPIIPMNTNKL